MASAQLFYTFAHLGQLWLLLRNLFFGSDSRFALPTEWKRQLIEQAPSRVHLTAEITERALEPLTARELEDAGINRIMSTGVSHGATLAQAFHLFYDQVCGM